ncbi:MAG: hypothetical protein Q4B57_01570 [Eubacteriales bacterium]|nr:hypothetical protein [Eubacteriales bacterium]
MSELYQKFCSTKQESLRLETASQGFFAVYGEKIQSLREASVSEEEHRAYERYLRLRLRPLLQQLLEQNDIRKLKLLDELGWLTQTELDFCLNAAKESGRSGMVLWLLHRKAHYMAQDACGEAAKSPGRQESMMADLGSRILKSCRSSLYLLYPYLDGAFAGLSYKKWTLEEKENYSVDLKTIATDGECIYYKEEFLKKSFGHSPESVRRGYLHMLLHCLYRHMLQTAGQDATKQRLWNLACDMFVEEIIEKEQQPLLTEPQGEELREAIIRQSPEGAGSPEAYFEKLCRAEYPFSTGELEQVFCYDDHSLWMVLDRKQSVLLEKKWERIQESAGEEGQGSLGRAGQSAGSIMEELRELQRSAYDYRHFLKQFAVMREELEIDQESFDYAYYHYGMAYYRNLPLIEPLEYREVDRLSKLVIAIDTSGSCTTKMVRQFLSETYGILMEKENFFEGQLARAFRFTEQCFGEEQEMLLLVSGLTRNPRMVRFLGDYGCEEYDRCSAQLLCEDEEALRRICSEETE